MKEFTLEELVVMGSGNRFTIDDSETKKPLVVRGVVKKDQMNNCRSIGRDFYYIDTGYVGNFPCSGNPSGKKIWHRIVKNGLQHSTLRNVPGDRWDLLVKQDPRLQFKGQKNFNKKILLVLPNPKATKYYDVDYDTWVKDTTEQIKKYSSLPVEVRVKGSRVYRNHEYSIYDAFDSGVYATVAFNSIAALESILYGIPAFVSVPCAASPLANNDLSQLGNPFFPSAELIQQQCNSLAYGQFRVDEIENGTAFKILEKYESNS